MSLEQAQRLISYIKDDAYIASYLGEGWNPGRVRRLRERSSKPVLKERGGHECGRADTYAHKAGHGSNANAERDAINGSRRLLEALLTFYERRAA